MKKRFLTAMLAGAFLLGSSSVFVSCSSKDYDDDINKLKSQIASVEDTVDDLQTSIAAGQTIKSVTQNADGDVTITMEDGTTYIIEAGEDGQSTIITIGDNGNWFINDVDTGKPSRGEKGEKGNDGSNGNNGNDGNDGKDGKYFEPGADGFWYEVDPNTNPVTKTKTQNKWTAAGAGLTIAFDGDYVFFSNFDESGKIIKIANFCELKGLVFEPDFYYFGIEAFEIQTIKYDINKPKYATVNADDDFGPNRAGGEDEQVSTNQSLSIAPDMAATYHLNPSNAKIDTDVKNYKYLVYNKEYVTRSTDVNVSSAFEIKSVKPDNGGKILVSSRYNGEVIKSIASDQEVTVMALQYTKGDSTITSDYAAIRANAYNGLRLNDPLLNPNTPNDHHNYGNAHLYTKMSDAINNPAWITVAWNNNDGIDLREYVNTHRDANTTNCKVWDTNAAAGLVEKSGFKYNFELIGYHVGDNTTSQSAHGAIKYDENTKEWNYRPSLTNNGKQQPWGYTQSQSTVGREPIVRVQLVDTVNNKVACVGYIKIAIVATTPATPKPNELVLNPGANEPYTIHCGDDNMDLLKITWWQVEEQIMHKVGLSKDDFEANYGLVKNGTATAIATARTTAGALDDLDQFKVSQDNNGDYTITNLTGANKIGSISQTKLDAADNETEVLYWSIKNQNAYTLFKNGATEVATWVCYKRIGGKGAVSELYVKFVWKPTSINLDPTSAFGDDNKTKMYWYANNNATAGSGYENIHGNVEVVGTTTDATRQPDLYAALMAGNNNQNSTAFAGGNVADDRYIFDIKSTLVGNKISIDALKAPYNNLRLGTDYKVKMYFVNGGSANGLSTLYASADGTILYADAAKLKPIAYLDTEKGLVYYGCGAAKGLPADATTTAKDLLNAVSHSDLPNSVTAKIAVKAILCEGEGTEKEIVINNNSFLVKFLRPVTISDAHADFEDAVTGGDTKAIQLTATDWRDHNFISTATMGMNYFGYYGLKNIFVDTANGVTNLNGTEQKLSDVTTQIDFQYIPPTYDSEGFVRAGQYGSMKYSNNGVTVGEFYVKFPATIEYDWGKVPFTLTVTVKKTQANAPRK